MAVVNEDALNARGNPRGYRIDHKTYTYPLIPDDAWIMETASKSLCTPVQTPSEGAHSALAASRTRDVAGAKILPPDVACTSQVWHESITIRVQ